MIDLHSHILPGIDDGAPNLEMSVAMARASVANGVTVLACTPHIMPGVWNNSGPQIRQSVANLQKTLNELEIPLHLVTGADVHIAPDLVGAIRSGRVLTLHDTRYILLELPHHVAPVHADECFFQLLTAGYVPVFTHPERLSWIQQHYDLMRRLFDSGVWMQITAGSLTGSFGSRAKYWAEKMLCDGLVHILASDTHNVGHRSPVLAEGWDAARRLVGDDEAYHLVVTRPYGILNNDLPGSLPAPPVAQLEGRDEMPARSGQRKYRAARSDQHDRMGDGGISRWMRQLFR
ncbi:MAG: capsular biosynthesis protein [Methylobacteriaceae bacterium]|nr:capsular biosynthesis protein [Rhodoblastus sp.]MCC0003661.1 capsular biosynthesis protein [Methylobacteriaceae bacterium]